MQRYFTSDIHIGYSNIHKYRPRFKSASSHHSYMINQILALPKRSLLLVLGDFLFDSPDFDSQLSAILKCRCHISLLMGNHDSSKLYQANHPNLTIDLPLAIPLPYTSPRTTWEGR